MYQLEKNTCKEILVTLKSASLPIQLHMMSSLKPKFINICHFTSHCFSNLCYPNNNIGWLVLSKQKCQQRHDEASYIKLSCQKLSNGNYDLFIYLFKLRVQVYLKKHIRYDMDICKTQNKILKLVEHIMGILMRIIALLVFYEFHIV